MKTRNPGNRRGIALVSILFMMALMVVLVVAIVLLSRAEMKSADTYSTQVSADSLSHVATNLVISQIRGATGQSGEAWASQPGAIRKYDRTGQFLAGYKLYSDDDMIITEETAFLNDVPESSWAEKSQHYVDLNAPVVRDSEPTFPILDPRAEGFVEGFSFTTAVDGTVKSDSSSARLPMPTRWIYVLQDGTTGHLDPGTNEFVGHRPDGSQIVPDKENPIVGRIAFWADDETAKLNINTASEPTFWDTPKSVSYEDLWYARAQPTKREYQRFPGHPATTALSTVLFGNKVKRETLAQLDGGNMQTETLSPEMIENKDIKEAIYDLVPRVNIGGSEAGTRVNQQDYDGIEQDGDHLYASLDEFIFKVPRLQGTPDQGREISPVVDRALLEKSRFFLTAHSRAPELNLFGLPRVSIWPSADETKAYRHLTAFDKLIRFCSTSPAGQRYFFTRKNPDSPKAGWNIPRNQEVYKYLKRLTSADIPGVGENLASKWGDDHEQILTEVFDYIRCTNLYDDSHPKIYYGNAGGKPIGGAGTQTQFTSARMGFSRVAEDDRWGRTKAHYAHGQVVPIRIGDTMGFGRFATHSSYSLVFICCAHPGESARPQRTGGDRIEDVIVHNGTEDRRIHYTNFPPMSPRPTEALLASLSSFPYDPVRDKEGNMRDGNDINHPGYDPINWNHGLKEWKNWNTTGAGNPTNCKADEIVVQMAFVPQFFVPGQGWTWFNPYLEAKFTGLDGLAINGLSLGFNNAAKTVGVWGSFSNSFDHERNWGGYPDITKATHDILTSDPIKITPTAAGGMSFTSSKTIQVKFYKRRNPERAANLAGTSAPEAPPLVQTINLDFPDADFPLPEIQRVGTRDKNGKRDSDADFWWSLNGHYGLVKGKSGVSIRDGGRGIKFPAVSHEEEAALKGVGGASYRNGHRYEFGEGRMKLRNVHRGSPWTSENNPQDPGWVQGVHKGGLFREGDVVRSLVPFHGEGDGAYGGDLRLVAAKHVVPTSAFKPHIGYFNLNEPIDHLTYQASGTHHYWRFGNADLHKTSTSDGIYPKFDYRVATQLTDASYHFSKFPVYPRGYAESPGGTHQSRPIHTGDFDNGVAITFDGPYINNPDGGNRALDFGHIKNFKNGQTPYFDKLRSAADQGPAYFSPNRQISSPVMFGSLPTGVKREIPWMTLLFRPQPWGHPNNFDFPHPGYTGAKDHHLLDLFWMPVVEPYAISEPFSTAGKINLNYQILPFTHIKRATGIHAVMKSEEMLVVSDAAAAHYKNWSEELASSTPPPLPENVHLRRLIDIDETLKQFDDRFLNGKIFKSASEICEVHLIPLQDRVGQSPITLPEPQYGNPIQASVDSRMKAFWKDHSPTGDNSRERPYSNIYPRVTTKSNTFRIHTRAQVLKKTRSSDPKTFDPDRDTVAGEWRGSTLIERYIDPNNEAIPDYVTDDQAVGKKTLDQFYRFRVLFNKRFNG